MIGLSVFDLLVLLVVFGGVAAVAFAVILNKESSNKPQPPQSNPYQQMPPVQQVPPAQQVPTAVDDAQPVEPTYLLRSVWLKAGDKCLLLPKLRRSRQPSVIFLGRGLNNYCVPNDYLIPVPFSSGVTDFFTRRELLRNRFCFFGLSVFSGLTHLSIERGNHAKNKKNEMGDAPYGRPCTGCQSCRGAARCLCCRRSHARAERYV